MDNINLQILNRWIHLIIQTQVGILIKLHRSKRSLIKLKISSSNILTLPWAIQAKSNIGKAARRVAKAATIAHIAVTYRSRIWISAKRPTWNSWTRSSPSMEEAMITLNNLLRCITLLAINPRGLESARSCPRRKRSYRSRTTCPNNLVGSQEMLLQSRFRKGGQNRNSSKHWIWRMI